MAIVESTITGNPYVGPRSITYGEPIHGRDRQIEELRNVVIAERVVLVYSPSGAGKSSLLEAGLRPELEHREFLVLPTIRVGLDAPAGNRYAVSAMLSLEEGRPEAERLRVNELAALTLTGYLDRVVATEALDADPCLFIDQFEEVFTLDPTDQDAKLTFLRDLGSALKDRGRWAVIAMREDFIAQLDPYLDLMPARLRARYRLDLLSPQAAGEAIRVPAAQAGRRMADDVVARLVDDLRTVQVQRGAGVDRELGPVVEPVQLQVVCRRLWDTLDEGATDVTGAEVGALGTVDESLAAYVDDAVAGAAAASGVGETTIRRWMDDELLTDGGFRTQVDRGPGGGAPGAAVLRHLEDAHLIRSERRRGTSWWELAHDRLVGPLQASNVAWSAAHDTPLTREARDWDAQGRPDALLARGRRLDLLARDESATAGGAEHDFLAASRTAERRRRRRLRTVVSSAAAVGILLVGLVIMSQRSAAEARRARTAAIAAAAAQEKAAAREAEAAARAAEAAAKAERAASEANTQKRAAQVGEARFLLLEAQRIAGDTPDTAQTAGRLALTAAPFVDPAQRVAALAAAGTALRDADIDETVRPPYTGADDAIVSIAAADDGTVAIGHPYGVELFGPDGQPIALAYGDPLSTGIEVGISPDGRWLVVTGAYYAPTTVFALRGTDSPTTVRTVGEPGVRASAIAFAPDGSLIALLGPAPLDGSGGQTVTLVRTDDWTAPTTSFTVTTAPGNTSATLVGPALTIDANGNPVESEISAPAPSRPSEVTAVAFGRDSRSLVMGDTNGDVVVRALDGTERTRQRTTRQNPTVVHPLPDGGFVVGGPITVDRVDAAGVQNQIYVSPGFSGGAPTFAVTDAAVIGVQNGRAVLVDIATRETIDLHGIGPDPYPAVAVSPDGSTIVAVGSSIVRWSVDGPEAIRAVVAPGNAGAAVLTGDDTDASLATIVWPASTTDPLVVRYHSIVGERPDVALPVAGTAGQTSGGCPSDTSSVRFAAFTADGAVLLVATGGGLLRWDVASRRLLDARPPLACDSPVFRANTVLATDRALVLTLDGTGGLRPAVLDFTDGSLDTAPESIGPVPRPAAATADGRFWSLTRDGLLRWSPADGWSTVALPGTEDGTSLALSPDGARVAVASSGRLLAFTTADGTRVADVRAPADLGPRTAFAADGTGLIYLGKEVPRVAVVDLSNGAAHGIVDPTAFDPVTGLRVQGGRVLIALEGTIVVAACDACAGVPAMTAGIRSLLDTVELGVDERSAYAVTLPTPGN